MFNYVKNLRNKANNLNKDFNNLINLKLNYKKYQKI